MEYIIWTDRIAPHRAFPHAAVPLNHNNVTMRKQLFNYFPFAEVSPILLTGLGFAIFNAKQGGAATLSMMILAISGFLAMVLLQGLLAVPTFVSDLRRKCLRRRDLVTFSCAKVESGDVIQLKGTVLAIEFGRPSPTSEHLKLFFQLEYPNGAWYCKISSGAEVHEVPFSWIARVE